MEEKSFWGHFFRFGSKMAIFRVSARAENWPKSSFMVKEASDSKTLLFRPPLKSQNMNIQGIFGLSYVNRADLAHFGSITRAEVGPKPVLISKRPPTSKCLFIDPH